jgi:hypothetical protein
MSNTQSIATSFKTDLLNGIHAFGASVVRAATTKDTFNGALYLATATLNAATTAYSATGEVPNSGSYTAGGIAFTTATAPAASGTGAIFTPSASWTTGAGFSGTAFDTILMYNATAAGKNAVSVSTFGSQTIVAGTFTLTMPANTTGNALIQLV